MKKPATRNYFLSIFALTLLFFGSISAQETQRKRIIIVGQPTPSPTPKIAPAATPIPAPTATPVAALTPAPAQTLAELQSRIAAIASRPNIKRGQIGIKIVSLDSGKVLFEQNAEKYFMPASNMKSFTVAAALDKLTPDFRFVTSVYADEKPDADGTIRGDLTIYGRGDPSFSTAFTRPDAATAPPTESEYLQNLERLADKITAAGIKKIEGNIIGDESFFNTNSIPYGWEWDDLQWYYGAEISALTFNDNALDVSIKPAAVGSPALIQLAPANNLITIINLIQTTAAGTKREIQITKKLAQNIIEFSGNIPLDDRGYTGAIAVSRPAMLFTSLVRKVLEQKGVKILGQTKVSNQSEKKVLNLPTALPPVEITRLESPPFAVIAAKTMKPSQNLYTELILRALGEAQGDKTNSTKTSEERGIEVVQKFLQEAGVAAGSVVQNDGSGLARQNLITPSAIVQLYTFMNSRPYAAVWREAQTVAGVDGTLKRRFSDTKAVGNVRGKTGTLSQVSSLSGYLTTASGERLVFSVLTNNIPETRLRTATIDEIVLLLTDFQGKSD